MRKLADDNLIKVIDTMSESPYEDYRFSSTPMTKLVIDEVDKTDRRINIYFEGEIEPYTLLDLANIDEISNIGTASGPYNVNIYLPEIITKPFEIRSYLIFDNDPGTITLRINIPETDAYLPLYIAATEANIKVKQFQETTNGIYAVIEKPLDYTSQEESWTFGYRQGIFYCHISSI